MKMQQIRERAKERGLKANGSKTDVIHRIQKAEGNDPCFATRKTCPQMDCCWREDCVEV